MDRKGKSQRLNFVNPKPICYDSDCFIVDGKDLFLFSGAVHYFRVPKTLWRDRLLKVKRASFIALETYVAWNWHEHLEGKANLSDLDNYLSLAEEMGFYIIVRPGPYICSEWDFGGFPRWLSAKRFPLRTDHPDSIAWSDYWFAEVMPIIAKHQITKGGRVILVQIENEYDYSGLPEDVMLRYLKSLFQSAIKHGIEVPLFTCWTKVARRNEDEIMAKIFDTCNFYTGWNFEWTAEALAKLRAEEPDSPLMVTELQGGWFSQFGDKLLPHQRDDLSPEQCNSLTKFLLAHGLSALNYYMLFGGTNFDYWGARHITTTYDYAAPIREPGGLWGKYYTVKLIGDFLRCFGSDLVRAKPKHKLAQSENEAVKVYARIHEDHGYLFLWNPSLDWQKAKVSLTLPNGEKMALEEPVVLSPKGFKILTFNFFVGQRKVNFTNLEVQSIVKLGERWVMVLYSEICPDGTPYQIRFSDGNEIRGVLKNCDEIHSVGEDLLIVVTSKERAGKTWRLEREDLPALEMLRPDSHHGLVVSNAYLLREVKGNENELECNFEVSSGETEFLFLLPKPPNSISVDGKEVKAKIDPEKNIVKFALRTELMPVDAVPISALKWRGEQVSAEGGKVVKPAKTNSPLTYLASLDDMKWHENGFYRYEVEFNWDGQTNILLLVSYAPDPKLVLLNERLVSEASNNFRCSQIPLNIYARKGRNKLTVLYEQAGRPNIGTQMNELKGMAGAVLIGKGAKELVEWRMRKTEQISESAPETKIDFEDSSWTKVQIGHGHQIEIGAKDCAWFRTEFELDKIEPDLMLLFEGVDDNAWVWLNGKKVGEHFGWDEPFILPVSKAVKVGRNILVVGVENRDGPGGIYAPVRLVCTSDLKVLKRWKVAKGLVGEHKNWHSLKSSDKSWRRISVGQKPPAREGSIVWYRAHFAIPKAEGWNIPWRLVVHATGDGNIWLNGIHIGRYQDQGPQREFYLPECWLDFESENLIAIALRSTEGIPTITSLRVEPYDEFAVKQIQLLLGM
ncbi:MAG: beta-galactosidase [Armatimonadetes bacterium]|nr:beta-galactosidase [Armatimonadota bacterium]MDW8026858.1 beta-galactosidase [Armatimonadota bacterium]